MKAPFQQNSGLVTFPTVHALSRRKAIFTLGLGLLGARSLDLGFPVDSNAAEASGPGSLPALNRFPRMVQEQFVETVRATARARDLKLASLRTKADAEGYVRSVREKIRACFGPAPDKSPLNPRITGIVERDAYRIEKVIFESRPGFLVTCNLYVPKGRSFPLPGVVGTCGHSANGKAAEAYQAFAQGLARQGYVVLIFDPIGQGERLQYVNDKLTSRIGVGVREHLHAGNQQFLIGEFFGSWRAWDGIRALDYLLTREEVDHKHVGLTGNSGGGTMTTWLCGLDQRWTMAAPSCFVTTFLRNLENELPADTEQCPPHALALGLDHGDFIAALAPKPVILLGKEKDYFDARGLEETFSQLQRLYSLLGARDHIELFIGPTSHGYTQENREAMYRWFNRVTGISNQKSEPSLTIEKDETLWCTPRGQVAELKSRTVFQFTQETAAHLDHRRKAKLGTQLADAVRSSLKLPERTGIPPYRILRALRGRRYPKNHFTNYAVETEPGIHALVYRLSDEAHYSRPSSGRERALLYVAHHSSDAELRQEPWIKALLNAEPNADFYACDVRGIGESRPNTCGQDTFLEPYGCDYFYAIHSLMLDFPYVGQKTHDILRVTDWLASLGLREVHIAAKGWGALPATFAAMLHDRIVQVTLKNALASYSDIARSEDYAWPLSSLLPSVLRHFDLPDCYESLSSKKLVRIDSWDARCQGS